MDVRDVQEKESKEKRKTFLSDWCRAKRAMREKEEAEAMAMAENAEKEAHAKTTAEQIAELEAKLKEAQDAVKATEDAAEEEINASAAETEVRHCAVLVRIVLVLKGFFVCSQAAQAMVAAKQKEIDDINAEKKEWEDMITCASFACVNRSISRVI